MCEGVIFWFDFLLICLKFGALIVLFIKVVFELRSYCEIALILLGW